MKKIKVCAIISNKAGKLLLQKRDEEPENNKWVLFGGSVDDGETEEAALRREIREELGYEIKTARFFARYEDNGIEQSIFVVGEPVEPDGLVLREGAAMGFFKPAGIQNLDIGFNFKKILLDYFNSAASSN